MRRFMKPVITVLAATLWIAVSEFLRNEFFLKGYWIQHYRSLGLIFPSAPVNGVIWGIWSLIYALTIFIVSKRFTYIQTFLLSWMSGFVLMWLVTGNLGILPPDILFFAVPLSLLESALASLIVYKFG